MIKQGRLTGAPGPHFASPIAADGHIFFTSEAGAVVVVAPGGDLTPLVVNDLAEETYATPAFADGRIYVRTTRRCTRSAPNSVQQSTSHHREHEGTKKTKTHEGKNLQELSARFGLSGDRAHELEAKVLSRFLVFAFLFRVPSSLRALRVPGGDR